MDRLRLFVAQHRTLVQFAAAFIVYGLLTLFYMGGAATNCTQSLLSFPGDNTAGLIAMFSIDHHDPWFGYTHVYSYPYGEALGQPTHITAQTLFVPFWFLAKLFGPVCGFNVLTIIGFMSAALTMFAFMRWLLGGRFAVPLLAGFAVAFTPYLQIKTGVHISYIFESLFIAAIWLFLALWKNPSLKKALWLGLVVALFAYTDGYFILLGGVLMVGLLLGALGYDYFKNERTIQPELRRRSKFIALAAAMALACMLPVLYVMFSSAGQINQALVSTRDTIGNEAQVYGARPLEYLLPNPMNPILSHVFGNYQSRNNHGSNPAENILSLSWIMIALATFFVVLVYRERRKKDGLKLINVSFKAPFLLSVFGVVLVVAFVASLPPHLGPIVTPTFVLIHVVKLWRVFARLSVIVNIALVVLAGLGLTVLLDKAKTSWRRAAICLLAFTLVFVEYLTFTPPRQVSGYEKVPEIYHWLHDQKQYAQIAEYPLDEFAASGYPVFYDTYQRVHGKEMLNGVISGKDAIFARQAVRDLTDPQAVPGLRALGIDFITIHSPSYPGDIPGLKLQHVSAEPILTTNGQPNKVWGYSVESGPKLAYAVAPIEGFHAPIKVSAVHQIQEMGHLGVLGFQDLSRTHSSLKLVDVLVEAKSVTASGQLISIQQGSKEVWRGKINPTVTTVQFEADPHMDVDIEAVQPTTDATITLPEITVIN